MLINQFLSTRCFGSQCDNRRKLPPPSHKADVLLQVSAGNITLHYSVKVLDPDTAAVYSRSESESSGRCAGLFWYQETQKVRTDVPGRKPPLQAAVQRLCFAMVSSETPREGEITLCQVIASQTWFGWRSGYIHANLWAFLRPHHSASHQTTGHPLFSEEARLIPYPDAQHSGLPMQQVRFANEVIMLKLELLKNDNLPVTLSCIHFLYREKNTKFFAVTKP